MALIPTAGYSPTPQIKKLGIKPGCRLALDHAPSGWTPDPLPDDAEIVGEVGPADVILSFFTQASDLGCRLPGLADRIFPGGGLWAAWPRRAAGHRSDITDEVIRAAALPLGIVDVKAAAIDEDWSGLRFVWRMSARAARR